jgi:O-methyltransferase domain/Dimerisation domain
MTEPPSTTLARLINGYQASQALHAAAVLGIGDALADGPRGVDDLAGAVEADPDALYRLLRALAALGVLDEGEDRTFALTEVGAGLRSDVPDSMVAWAAFIGRPYYWEAWSRLVHSVRTGENAFRMVHGVDPWGYRLQEPAEGAIFDRAMAATSRRGTGALVAAYDFGRFGTLVDVGGGNGGLIRALLERHPASRGVLFDQPHVVAGATPADRLEIVGGSFFERVPPGGDAYLLKWILHDWEDRQAATILRVVRAAMGAGAVVLVIERELAGPNEGAEGKLSDLNMLVAPGGRERSRDEYAALFEDAGLELTGVTPTSGELRVFEGVRA